jgi:hypothetical protein
MLSKQTDLSAPAKQNPSRQFEAGAGSSFEKTRQGERKVTFSLDFAWTAWKPWTGTENTGALASNLAACARTGGTGASIAVCSVKVARFHPSNLTQRRLHAITVLPSYLEATPVKRPRLSAVAAVVTVINVISAVTAVTAAKEKGGRFATHLPNHYQVREYKKV